MITAPTLVKMSKSLNFNGISSTPKGLLSGALSTYSRRVYSSKRSGLPLVSSRTVEGGRLASRGIRETAVRRYELEEGESNFSKDGGGRLQAFGLELLECGHLVSVSGRD